MDFIQCKRHTLTRLESNLPHTLECNIYKSQKDSLQFTVDPYGYHINCPTIFSEGSHMECCQVLSIGLGAHTRHRLIHRHDFYIKPFLAS
jgi:hypothetical protein